MPRMRPQPPQQRPSRAEPSAQASTPVHTIRHRNLKASIWRNVTDKGNLYNVTIVRGYRDEQQQWHDSHSFGYDDLTIAAKLLNDCHSFITTLRARESAAEQKARRAAEPA
jgi:hypothetical protein